MGRAAGVITQRRSLPEQLGPPHHDGFPGGAASRNIKGFAMGLRIRIGEQAIEMTLQVMRVSSGIASHAATSVGKRSW